MENFTVRVELHDAESSDYDALHKAMQAQGFSKTITDSESGKVFELPTAEYNYSSNETRADVAKKAKAIADKIKAESSVLVTQSNGRYWLSLKKV